jgi:hypothetical protein
MVVQRAIAFHFLALPVPPRGRLLMNGQACGGCSFGAYPSDRTGFPEYRGAPFPYIHNNSIYSDPSGLTPNARDLATTVLPKMECPPRPVSGWRLSLIQAHRDCSRWPALINRGGVPVATTYPPIGAPVYPPRVERSGQSDGHGLAFGGSAVRASSISQKGNQLKSMSWGCVSRPILSG